MRCAVLTLSVGEDYKKVCRNGRINKLEYCKIHDYPLIEDENVVDRNRRLQWGKIKLIEKYLPMYDYIMWVDSDTYVTNMYITIESMIALMGSSVFMYEKDPYIWVNSGWIVAKNDPWVFSLLSQCYTDLSQICDEQGSIDYLYRSNWNEAHNRIRILDHSKGFNQYWFTWKEGDFMIHFPGCHEPELKKDCLAYMMDRFCPFRREDIIGKMENEEEFLNRLQTIKSSYLVQEYSRCRSLYRCLPLEVYL